MEQIVFLIVPLETAHFSSFRAILFPWWLYAWTPQVQLGYNVGMREQGKIDLVY